MQFFRPILFKHIPVLDGGFLHALRTAHRWLSLVEHRAVKGEVVSPTPARPTLRVLKQLSRK